MKLTRFLVIIMALILRGATLDAQTQPLPQAMDEKEKNLVQFSGLVVTEERGQMVPVPYANIFIPTRKVGTTANYQGFFSIVVEKGESINFTALGFRKSSFVIPQSLKEDRYSLVKIMSRDTILLDEAIIFPWPSREHFKTEFLAMNVTDELEKRAMENLASETLEKVREVTPFDGKETGSMYLRQQARNYYYYGQTPPMNIFSPTAWQQFFKSWKNGDYKKKKSTGD
ncbi:MAG: carboxypeptidase-like regulatory domain-containing protein [Saprospiraceae bacterium]|nr:carboxypeptidase-like regulatory domain-containing protein [Saprospiraceae bacterium]